jgi:hypothetical protein
MYVAGRERTEEAIHSLERACAADRKIAAARAALVTLSPMDDEAINACLKAIWSYEGMATTHDQSATADLWANVGDDAQEIERDGQVLTRPLWMAAPPEWFALRHEAAIAHWRTKPQRWGFWLRWWEGVVSGQQVDLDVQRRVAEIPDEVWRKGPEAVAEAIRGIETPYALAATDNAETIEEDAETGKLHLVPTSALHSDLGGYVRRKIIKAVDLFGEAASTQQYRAIAPDLDMLRRAEADAGNLPVELYDACASATRRLAMRAEAGECPAPDSDPLLADYRNRLIDAAADILAHDPMTREVLERRNRIKGNTALIDGKMTLNVAVQIVLPGTEGRLADTLPQDGMLATDPQANPEERKDASVRLAGRMLRIMIWIMQNPVKGTAVLVVGGGLAQVGVRGMDWIIDSALKPAWEIIMKYLGL